MTINDGSRMGTPRATHTEMKNKYATFRRGKKSVAPAMKRDLSVEDMINTSLNK
jgi:hypothetical protein